MSQRSFSRRHLPPLNALRAFEAVARSQSFTKAAEELLVTQSAVSRQVKNLEDILGVTLILRKAQFGLTEEGRRLLPVLTEAFDRLDTTIGGFRRQSKKPPLSLSLPPTFARRIVLPRLAEFQRAHADLEIRVETPPVNVDFKASIHDVAIFYGEAIGADLLGDMLMRERIAPLASPALLAQAQWPDLKTMAAKARLLHVRQSGDAWVDWRLFLRQMGLAGIAVERGLVLETADQAVQSALAEGGVALCDPRLFAEEIASGRLVMPFPAEVLTGRAYSLICRPDEADLARIAAFRAWALAALVVA